MRAAVVVVGDLGRSPRMQYHARALASHHAAVDLIGYTGAALLTPSPAIRALPFTGSASRGCVIDPAARPSYTCCLRSSTV